MDAPFHRIRLTSEPEFIRYEHARRINPNILTYELWSFIEGKGEMKVDGSILTVSSGSAFVFPPGSSPTLILDSRQEILMFRVGFDILDTQDHRVENLSQVGLTLRNPQFFFQLAYQACSAFKREDSLSQMRSKNLIEAMLLHILDENENPTQSPTHVIIDRLILEIQQDPSKDWGINILVKRAGLSRSHLSLIFSSITGMSPTRFVIQARIARATRLIEETDLTIGQIAQVTGYRDIFFFSRQYKKIMGHNPNDLRSRNKTQIQELLKQRKGRTLISLREHEFEKVNRAKAEVRMHELERKVEKESKREWELVLDEKFQTDDFTDRWEVLGGTCKIRDETLEAAAGSPMILTHKAPIPGDIAVEFECYQEGDYLNDISCFVAGVPRLDKYSIPETGYLFMYGACGNSVVGIERKRNHLWSKKDSPLKSGKRYRIRAEKCGRRCVLTVNQKVIFDVQDENPTSSTKQGLFGFYLWQAKTIFTRIQVFQLRAPMKEYLLDVATRHLDQHHFGAAIEIFQQILHSSKDPEKQEKAKRGLEAASTRLQISHLRPSIERLLLNFWPKAKIEMGDEGLTVDLYSCGVTDLSPLQGLPIVHLDLDVNEITSLEPLKGMKLRSLLCRMNKITDLTPLEKMPLEFLSIGLNQISSLEPLRGISLKKISCYDNKVGDLSPLMGMPLVDVYIHGNRITNLNGLQNSPVMRLICSDNEIDDLKPIQECPLIQLDCSGNRITSLKTLRKMSLSRLICDKNLMVSLEPFLANHPPAVFHFDSDSIPSKELRKAIQIWRKNAKSAGFAKDAEVLLALREHDFSKLKSLAEIFKDHLILRIPKIVSWQEAKAFCEKLEGNLIVIPGNEKNRFIQELSRSEDFWIGLFYNSENPTWVTGEELRFNDFISKPKNKAPVLCGFNGWSTPISILPKFPFFIEWKH
jgi:AraC family transcriptional regulator, arabinose operon regulatory protein